MQVFIFLLVVMNLIVQTDEWTPPEDPDPGAILSEARADAQMRQYSRALSKHVWFHEHALEIQPAQYGVRLSFALSYWIELGEKYPPAIEKLKEIRDDAAKKVIAGKEVREWFHDMEAINTNLGEDQNTVTIFKSLDKKQPKKAESVFGLARPALVRAKEYEICGRYIAFEEALSSVIEQYQAGKKRVNDGVLSASHMEHVTKRFSREAAMLVALLAVNDRKGEAGEFAKLVRRELDDKSFHAALEKSLEGVVPAPWP